MIQRISASSFNSNQFQDQDITHIIGLNLLFLRKNGLKEKKD